MALTTAQAIAYGTLALCAEDNYTDGALAPVPDPRILAAGWTITGLLTAEDAIIPDSGELLDGDASSRVYYGFVARNHTDQNLFVVAIRGTAGGAEWLIDAKFAPKVHPKYPNAKVELGFWTIFQSMSLADPTTGATTHQDAAEGVAAMLGDQGRAIVTGHSLGAALATYLAEAIAARKPRKVSACLFASPRTGDAQWTAIFDAQVADYLLFTYILDAVTHVPAGPDYSTLSKAVILEPATAQASVKLDLFCNHHLVDYFAMIDYTAYQGVAESGDDKKYCMECILGGPGTASMQAKALAALIKEFGVGARVVLAAFKAL